MLPIKVNQKSQYKEDLACHKDHEETQEHILTECPTLQPIPNDIDYENLNDDQGLDQLRKFAKHIIATERKMEHTTWSPIKVRSAKT